MVLIGLHHEMINYDEVGSEYARNRRVHPGVLFDLVLTSGIDSASKVLEVGCGTGNYIIALKSLLHCSSWGIDPSKETLAKARERTKKVKFQLGRAEELDFPRGFFDLVFSVDVIQYVGDRRSYFEVARKVLRPGGTFCTATESDWIIRHRQPLAVYFPETVKIDLARHPSIPELREIMGKVGLGEIKENVVEFPYQITDIQPYRDKAFSSLKLIGEGAFQKGLKRMERDLRAGPINCFSRYALLWGMARKR